MVPPLTVVVSYSHKDEEHRQALGSVLSTLQRQKLVDLWSDHRIKPGTDIDQEITDALCAADLVLLLISADFIASDYCYLRELKTALVRHEKRASVVVPLIVRPCDWEALPFGRLKALPTDGLPITTWQNRDSAWLDVSKNLRSLVEDLVQKKRLVQSPNKAETIRDHLRDEFTRLTKRYESPESLSVGAISLGVKELDVVFDGVHCGDLVVFAGRPNMGHHDLILGAAIHASLKQDVPVLFISPRDSGAQVMRRCISSVARVPWGALTDGDLGENDWPRLSAAITILSESKLTVEEFAVSAAGSLIGQIEERLNSGCGMVVIEGLDYFAGDEAEAFALVRGLKGLCRRYSVPTVCSLTVPPGPEERYDKRPLVHDLKYWYCLEEEADQIALMYRDDVYDRHSVDAGVVEISVAKNRHGPVRSLRASFEAQYRRIEEIYE